MRPTEGPPYLSCALFNSFPGKPQATQNINKEINLPLLHLLSFVVYWRFGKKPKSPINDKGQDGAKVRLFHLTLTY